MKIHALFVVLLIAGCQFEEDGVTWVADAGGAPDAEPTPPIPDEPDAAPTCEESLTLCEGECVDTERDDDHCGACGIECDDDQECRDSECRRDNGGPGGGDD